MKIGDLTYVLGAEWDNNALKNIENGFATVSKSFMTAVGVASTALAGTFAVVKEFASANDELGKLARNKDIAIGSLQAMQYSFSGAGVEASKVGDILGKLQEQKEAFRTGKADYEAFAQIGVNPRAFKNNEDYFNAVLDGLKSIKDEAQQSDLSKRILGSADMKNVIDGGSEAIRNQKKELEELGILISQQDYRKSADFNDTLLKTTTILKGLANKIMTSLMPLFTNLMKKFNEFMKANRELIQSGLKEFFSAIIDGSQFFLSLIGRVIEHLGGMKVVITVIAGLLLLWQAPLIITIALITLVFLAFDDVMNFIKGNDSVIGDWLASIVDGFEEFKKNFPNLGMMFQLQFDAVKAIFVYFKDTIFNIWDLIIGKVSFSGFLTNQVTIVNNLLNSIKDIFLKFVEWIKSLFNNLDIFGGLKKQLKNLKDSISSLIPDMTDITKKITSYFPDFSKIGLSKNTQAPTNTTIVDNNRTPPSNNTTNNYNITATVNANGKNVSQVLAELSQPAGYR